ncbi:hypothetical protein QN277_028982 [Acacia crassicarpa]|uniref:Uncharacterized protein n=1 Tax=Acacia crassicarpa TaxID=499986 RepID=A0AAE1MKD6_9FABA|nr:hypothetical protein QN277_028982 [Acacia crassicarpa]
MAVAGEVADPQMVGNAFVQQYYSILHHEPNVVFRFYQETSVLSRPEEDGTMSLVTTVAAIKEKFRTQDLKKFRVEILSADSQSSYKNGVMVVVTGCLMGDNDLKRKFTQSFFLAPQDKGFFVLNDVFRYIDDHTPVVSPSMPANDADESAPTASLTPEPEPTHVPENIPPSQAAVVDTDIDANKEVNQQDDGELSESEKEVDSDAVKETSQQESHPVIEKSTPSTQEDTPKKSFASIVNALKDNAAPFHVRTLPAKTAAKPVEQRVSSTPVPEAPASNSNPAPEKNNDDAGKAYAIFVANLPMNATVEQLEREFKKFGPIKPDGIQVRSNKQQASCFGFVEFEAASSMHSALEASPVILDNRKLSIEERRANNDRVKYSSGRGGFRNDNYRGRGNFGGGGRGFSRNDGEKRGEFSGRPRGRNGESGPRAYQNGARPPRQEVKVQ